MSSRADWNSTSAPLRGVANYKDVYKVTHLCGPSGIIVLLAQSLKPNIPRGRSALPAAALTDESADMRIVIVYESMFGNTRQVADSIAAGLGIDAGVIIRSVDQVDVESLANADLVVVGAPTHAHSLSRASTRAEAERQASVSGGTMVFEPEGAYTGVREWLTELEPESTPFVAFDTRADIPRLFSGAASSSIDRELATLGFTRLAAPESFLMHGSNLDAGELERARAWGEELHSLLQAGQPA